MKNLISKLKSKCKNRGSGLVLVVVAVAFIGILAGSLLTAVGYAYRLKLYDYNAKDNFYYLEQAMDEVYAGVGTQTLTYMQEAYTEVVNNMVKYSAETKSYVTKDAAELNKNFATIFLARVADSDLFSTDVPAGSSMRSLDIFLNSYITNSDVKLIPNKATVVKFVMDGDTEIVAPPSAGTLEYSSIIIKGVTLTRTANYNRSKANGDFTQTISADIVISQPDFVMDFNSVNLDYSNLFDYTMIADNGIEFTQNQQEISVSGNIYAAADFYNKSYNNYDGNANPSVVTSGFSYTPGAAGAVSATYSWGKAYNASGEAVAPTATSYISAASLPSISKSGSTVYNNFNNGPVSYKAATSLRNSRLMLESIVQAYDGVAETSMYSGMYIKGSKVNIQAAEVIVPGTISVMDAGNLSLYGKSGMNVGEADIWADNVVLGGNGTTAAAPNVLIRGNMHVRDDLELNANYSNFQLVGRYYGFGNSTKSDARVYVPTVNSSAYFYSVDGTTTNLAARGHYNSSAIVINGQQSKLNLSETNALFLAGRTYIELSKEYGNAARKRAVADPETEETQVIDDTDEEGNTITEKTYVFNANTDDVRTGESVSLKTNQLAYAPINITATSTSNIEEITESDSDHVYYLISLPSEVQTSVPFQEILGGGTKMEKVPCLKYSTTDGTEYYIDFATAYRLYYTNQNKTTINFNFQYKNSETATLALVTSGDITINSADDLSKQYIIWYNNELGNYASTARNMLKNIGAAYDGFSFDEGVIQLSNNSSNIYSSGALTIKDNTSFTITAQDNLQSSLTGTDMITGQTSEYDKMLSKSATMNTSEANVALTADDFETRYAFAKWALQNYNDALASDAAELEYIKTILSTNVYGESYITPINRYLNMNQITSTTNIHPTLSGVSSGSTLSLPSGYSVWISNNDVTVSTDREDGVVQGIIVTKGNVFFDKTVSKFEGLIVSGDKIFVDNFKIKTDSRDEDNAQIITSISASPEVVRSILTECMGLTSDTNYGTMAKKVLNVFKAYENFAHIENEIKTIDVSYKTIDTIQYSDVVRYNNWMKNVTTAVGDEEETP